jgi:MFS family permease
VATAPGRTFGALRHRNFRLYLTGQIISTTGTWMQSVALPWLALQLTHNGFLVGVVLAAQFLPVLIGGQLGGEVVDRYRKRDVLLFTQAAFMLPSLALFLLSQSGHVEYWMLIVAAIATGTTNAVDHPARQSFMIEMVGKRDLMNGIALNSSVFNAATFIGPSIAGLLIGAVGLPLCFLVNALTRPAAITALLLMRDLPNAAPPRQTQPVLERLAQGAAYARNEPVVGMMLIAVAVFSLFAMNRLTILPLFADQVLGVGATGFGFLLGSMGLGALLGAMTLAFFPRLGADSRRQLWMALIWVASLLVFSVSRSFPVSVATLLVAGYCQMSFIATANNRIQVATPDHLRGRVMALYAQALIGVGPIGSLQAGALATKFGAPWAMAIGAVVAGSVILLIRLLFPEVFGHPSQTSSTADTASAGTSQRSART